MSAVSLTPFQKKVLDRLDAQECGEKWLAICPSCQDPLTKLAICIPRSGELDYQCNAGCHDEVVAEAIRGLIASNPLSSSREPRTGIDETVRGYIESSPYLESVENATSSDETLKATETGWEPPIPLNEIQAPPFPVETLPNWLREFVCAEAVATQTPPDLSAVLGLAALSTALARKFRVHVRDGYDEPVNLYLVVVLGPGNRKTAVFSHISEPIERFEETKSRELAPKVREKKALRDLKERELDTATKKAAVPVTDEAGRKQNVNEVLRITEELSDMALLVLPRLLVDDCTPERLASLLAEHDGKMSVMSAEGGIFEIIGGRYSKDRPNLDVYLKGHAGDELRVDREKEKDNPKFLKSPAVTFGLAVQPEVLNGLMNRQEFRGRGLLGRFLYSIPRSPLGTRESAPPTVTSSVMDLFRINIIKLMELPWNIGADGKKTHHLLALSPSALESILFFAEWLEPRLAPFGELGHMPDWAGKLVGAVIRIAGNLHLAEQVDSASPWEIQISANTMENAIKLGEYFIPHAEAAYLQMGADPNVAGARRVLGWVEKNARPVFPKQELWQGTKGYFQRVEKLDAALKVVEQHGYLREVQGKPRVGAGRKPAPSYEVNPLWHAYNSYNPSNGPSENHSSIFRDSRTEGEEHV